MDITEFNALAGASAHEFSATGLNYLQFFMWAIRKQNLTYDLPVSHTPSLDNLGESPVKRMTGFLKTLQKEMAEGEEILNLMKLAQLMKEGHSSAPGIESRESMSANLCALGVDEPEAHKLAKTYHAFVNHIEDEGLDHSELLDRFILVSLADWFADMGVYNRSEAMKYGLPLESVQTIVMNSNFTKLGEDGLPIKDENGKFLKGPNFIAPEHHIYALMFDSQELLNEASDVIAAADAITTLAVPTLDDPMAEVHVAADLTESGENEDGYSDEDEADEDEADE